MKPFRFKHFSVNHDRCAMKVGVDGVLLGVWADVSNVREILDAGCGCGVIALMCAQRNPLCRVRAIDIDPVAVGECRENFSSSPWADRLGAETVSFASPAAGCGYDLIISNPPFFDSGVDCGTSPRMAARHQGELSPLSLIDIGKGMIKENGRLAMIIPYLREEEVLAHAARAGLKPRRITRVRGNLRAPVKRTLLELSFDDNLCEETELVLETNPGEPTPEYRKLAKDFYLRF